MIKFNEFKEFILSIKDEITSITKRYYYSDLEVENKSDHSPVTLADKEIEAYIRSEIEKRFPCHTIIGEEYGAIEHNNASSWIIDPIDGTYSFIHQIPLFTTLIAYCYNSKPVYGMIYQPISDELAIGSETKSYYNSKYTKLRNSTDIKTATIITTSTTNIEKFHNGKNFKELALEAKTVRTWGDGYGYLMLISGRADVMIDPKMKLWDLAALIPIVRGAGGVITDFKGGDPEIGNSIVATTNQKLHNYIIDKLNK